MPVVDIPPPARSPDQVRLLNDLVAELRQPHDFGQPRILIRTMPRGGLRHVEVIWDRWADCPPDQRGEIVRDAFAIVRGREFADSIALTIPATVEEAIEMDRLPYGVRPARWHNLGDAEREEVCRALTDHGASAVPPGARPLLRFGTPGEAEAARARLATTSPTVEWEVTYSMPEAVHTTDWHRVE